MATANVLSASRPGVGSVILSPTVAVTTQIVGVGTVGQSAQAAILLLTATDPIDQAAFTATVRDVLHLTLAATETADHAAFNVSVVTVSHLALAATDPVDHASFAVTVVPLPVETLHLAATEAPDRMSTATMSIVAVTNENSLQYHVVGSLPRLGLRDPAPRWGPRGR